MWQDYNEDLLTLFYNELMVDSFQNKEGKKKKKQQRDFLLMLIIIFIFFNQSLDCCFLFVKINIILLIQIELEPLDIWKKALSPAMRDDPDILDLHVLLAIKWPTSDSENSGTPIIDGGCVFEYYQEVIK